jgi:hypothetical protein
VTVDYREAVLAVLAEESGGPVHWTTIQDLALQRGLLDPFEDPQVRKHLLSTIAELVADGSIRKRGTGVYSL